MLTSRSSRTKPFKGEFQQTIPSRAMRSWLTSFTFTFREHNDSLDEAKAMMPLFGPLIEGLKRRLWL